MDSNGPLYTIKLQPRGREALKPTELIQVTGHQTLSLYARRAITILWHNAHQQGVKGFGPEITKLAVHFDQFGLDSDHDYDPVWRKCLELKIAPTFHTGGRGQGLRNTPSNFTFNHIGHFAAAGHAVAKSLFLGGITRRFPDLRFGFLEGGAGWACQLFADLIEH